MICDRALLRAVSNPFGPVIPKSGIHIPGSLFDVAPYSHRRYGFWNLEPEISNIGYFNHLGMEGGR